MNPKPSKAPPFPVDDALIDEAAAALDIAGRLEGHNGLLLMDVAPPRALIEPGLAFLSEALVGLHLEALEDPLRAGDQSGIDEACDLYRGLLASRLKAVLKRPDGHERLSQLRAAGRRP